jgi:glyoxylase-like metal-dependent hydrolase (beta-lactamase superfamily II)
LSWDSLAPAACIAFPYARARFNEREELPMPLRTPTPLRTIALAGIVALATLTGVPPADAAAPLQTTQAPGYFRMMLGDIEVTALLDGTIDLEPKKLLTNVGAPEIERSLARSFQAGAVPTSVNAFLVNTGGKLVLVDAGAAGLFGPTLGRMLVSLKAAGYQPEQVDDILVTHLHPDHVGGLMAGDKIVFPNATVHADQRDVDFWLSKEQMDKAPADAKAFFQGAMASLNPYVTAGRLKAFTGTTDLLPGIRAVAANGHTPGHTVYEVSSQGQKLLLWGDLMHMAAVQFPDPKVTIAFDVNSKAAAAERLKLFAQIAKNRTLVAGAHLPFPGLGHLRAEGRGYAWVPLDYNLGVR